MQIIARSRQFVVAITATDLVATIASGAYDHAEASRLVAAWGTTQGSSRDSLVDITRLTAVDASAFATLRDVLEAHRDVRAQAVRAQAIVSGSDLGGAVVMGYLAAFPPPYPFASFATRRDALTWLGHEADAGELDALDPACDTLVARVRDWLERSNFDDIQIDTAARTHGVTPRTLQRRLAAEGTRYSSEVARAQIARAQRLMSEPGRKLSDIALEVGCSSPSVFCDLFRRVTGLTATQWRQQLTHAREVTP